MTSVSIYLDNSKKDTKGMFFYSKDDWMPVVIHKIWVKAIIIH